MRRSPGNLCTTSSNSIPATRNPRKRETQTILLTGMYSMPTDILMSRLKEPAHLIRRRAHRKTSNAQHDPFILSKDQSRQPHHDFQRDNNLWWNLLLKVVSVEDYLLDLALSRDGEEDACRNSFGPKIWHIPP